MRMLMLAVAVAVTGCGGSGSAVEMYAFVLGTVTIPASCFQTAPMDTVQKGPLGTTNVTVWDGPEAKAFMNPDTSLNFPLGDAPAVTVSTAQVLEGATSAEGWTFTSDIDVTDVTTVLGGTRSLNSKTRIDVTFGRAKTGMGTVSLSSSESCTGTGCPTFVGTCSITGIPLRYTRLAVEFERTP